MGTSAKTLSRLVDLHRSGLLKNGASIIEFGAQQLFCAGQGSYLREVIGHFASHNNTLKAADHYTDVELAQLADKGLLGRLMQACGFAYQALDIFEAENTILFDLNLHQPGPELRERFDLVTNFGTTEHLINQYQAMKTAHELAKPGGIIYHDLPLTGYHDHGYFSYNPPFFMHLAEANRYRVVMQHYSKGRTPTLASASMIANGYPDPSYHDYAIEFIFQKTSADAFRMPLDTSTSLTVSKGMWGDTMPYATRQVSAWKDGGAYSAVLEPVPRHELQRELMRRYRRRLARLFGLP
jgi:hypothetical protein